jgi:glycosyltransferase involved in cell wall biosynthesis
VRIGLEASYAFMGRGGIDRYAWELFSTLLRCASSNEYQLFTLFFPFRVADLTAAPFRSTARRKVAMAQVELLRRCWSRLGWPSARTLAGPVDLVHVVHHFAAPVPDARLVITVHDLSFEYPEFRISKAPLYSRDVQRAIQCADCIIAVSSFTRDELCRLYGVPEQRIRVVHEGVRAAFWESPSIGERSEGHPYFLAVGKIEARKNLIELAEAVSQARRQFALPHELVLVGKQGHDGPKILEAIKRVDPDGAVVVRSFLSDVELRRLYQRATAMVYPSLYEGFGLPILEAMAAGTPVIAADTASIPEVVGDAAVVVTPGEPGRWAEALHRVATDEDLRRTMIEAGRRRARMFTWEKAAQETAAVYHEVLGT